MESWIQVLRTLRDILWIVLIYEACLCAAGSKLTVLYLRRFRLTTAPAVVTAALEQGLSKRYRVVTLDDATFPPMEVPRLYRRLSRYGGPLVWSTVTLAVVVVAVGLYRQAGPTITGVAPALALMVLIMGLGPLFLVVFPAVVVVLAGALLWQRRLVRKSARLAVRSRDDVDRVEATVVELGRWRKRSTLLAPRATIVSVTDDLWRVVVDRLVQHSNVVLVDISVSTDNLRWELALLATRSFAHTVFVADRTAEPLTDIPVGRSCVFYDARATGRERMGFLNALTRALDEHAQGPPPLNYRECLVQPVMACLRVLLMLVVMVTVVVYLLTVVLSYLFGA